MIPKFSYTHSQREKRGFGASDYGRLGFDIFHTWKATLPTNPTLWTDTLRMGAGKGAELAMIEVLKQSHIIHPLFDQDKEETYEMSREGVPIRMKIDAIVDEALGDNGEKISIREDGLYTGAPIEIKTINNKNSWDIKSYENDTPRESYVGQLAIYMDYLQKRQGYLFVSSIDGLSYFWFECNHLHDRVYACGKTIVDLDKEYKRWNDLYTHHILVNNEPDPFEAGRYKIPIKDIDWTKVSVSDIAKARAGTKVIGDPDSWKISYSPYKKMIVDKQGTTIGYTDTEIEIIRQLTAGYSARKK